MLENKTVAGKQGLVANGPVRMCVICRRRFPKAALTRHVLTPQKNLSIDPEKTRPGRGWYLCSDPGCALKFAKYRPGARRAAAVTQGTPIALTVAAQPLADKDSRETDGDSLDKGGKHA